MSSIKVKRFNPYTNKDVDKLFSWHKESGRLCEVNGLRLLRRNQ